MARAGVVVESALRAALEAVHPGATTHDIDSRAAEAIRTAGATSNFLGYFGYPATTCISVNDEVVHGIPGDRVLAVGDIVSIDCGAVVDGWHGDSAVTVIVGEATDPRDSALVEATRLALWDGIAAFARAAHVVEISAAIEAVAEGAGLAPADGYVGHGIGTEMHQAPDVPNVVERGRGARLRTGMCLAIEPMFCDGDGSTRVLDDEWTVVTGDGGRAAHWEHSVAIHSDGIWVLTASDGGASELAAYGIIPVAP